jgi:hypothetical protein
MPVTAPVVAQAAGELVEDEVEAEQLGLFGEPVTEEGLAKAISRGRRGPGRPPGARNKRTERSVAFLLSRHRDPREVLLEIAESNVFDLAALLGCKPFEALGEKRLAAIGVLPYVAARITPEVLKQFNGIFLTVVERPEGAAGEGIGVSAQILDHVEFERTADRPSAATDDEPIG